MANSNTKFANQLLFSFLFAFALTMTGCESSASSDVVQNLKKCHADMQAASGEFETALASVVDEATAIAALPLLQKASDKMVEVSKPLEQAMDTQSRMAIAIKKEVNDFRLKQKETVDEHVRRIKKIPEAESILKDFLKKIGKE